MKKERFILGERPYKRFFKSPCLMFMQDGNLDIRTIALDGDVIDTKGMSSRDRKKTLVVLG